MALPFAAPPQLLKQSFGPFGKGAIDAAGPLLNLQSALKDAQNLRVVGINQVLARKGTTAVMTFNDGAGTPPSSSAFVTSIRAIAPFKDRALVVAHSTTTNAAYVYLCASDFTGWYDASDTLTSTTTASPVATLWSSITTPPDVTVAEGLGQAFIAHTTAADHASLNWPTKLLYSNAGTWTVASLASDLNADASAETLYFSGLVSFQQHLWAWGFGSGTTAATGYDPSKARYSGAIFATGTGGVTDLFSPVDSMTLGNRVGSEREKIIGGAVAGNALFLFGRTNLTKITGYGRDTWQREMLDKSYGLIGPKAYCVASDVCYYWSNRGPMRVSDTGAPDPLWDPIATGVQSALGGGDPANIVAGFARDLDQVQFFYQASAGEGLVRFAAFDVRRDIWLGPDSAVGVTVACAGDVEPVYTTTSPPAPPAAAPTITAATSVGQTSATINWTTGDGTAETVVQYRVHGTSPWTTATTADPGVTSYGLTGLVASTGYDAEVYHVKNGQSSTVSANTTPYFTTAAPAAPLRAPTNPDATSFGPPGSPTDDTGQVTWTNTEALASTEVWQKGPGESSYTLIQIVSPGGASYTTGPVSTSGTYSYEMRHVKTGSTPSAYTTPVSMTLNKWSGAA